MKIHNVEQGSPEWFELRKGRMTASHAQAIGNNGKGLDTYITELMAEYHSHADKEQFSNEHTERGKELEEFAAEMYELENDVTIEKIGFVEDGEFAGCSPDGLVGEEGGVEIKSLNDVNHYKIIRDGEKEIDSKYIWQVQMCLLLTGRKWWDLIFYNPNFEKSLVVFRIEPDEEKQEALKEGLKEGEKMIKSQLKI